ncbi:MAG TPA: hypothetical protein PLD07_03740, partial [Bacillota bacterium]|nr:hypothetical protein [Bacillota bacterium]
MAYILMHAMRMLSENDTSQAFETVVSALIVLLTAVLLFLLFRNISKELRKSREDRKAIKKAHDEPKPISG